MSRPIVRPDLEALVEGQVTPHTSPDAKGPALPPNVQLDGELVAFDSNGNHDFHLLT